MRLGDGLPPKSGELLDSARKVELGDLFALRTGGLGLAAGHCADILRN
jgi:hypothetical protein